MSVAQAPAPASNVNRQARIGVIINALNVFEESRTQAGNVSWPSGITERRVANEARFGRDGNSRAITL